MQKCLLSSECNHHGWHAFPTISRITFEKITYAFHRVLEIRAVAAKAQTALYVNTQIVLSAPQQHAQNSLRRWARHTRTRGQWSFQYATDCASVTEILVTILTGETLVAIQSAFAVVTSKTIASNASVGVQLLESFPHDMSILALYYVTASGHEEELVIGRHHAELDILICCTRKYTK